MFYGQSAYNDEELKSRKSKHKSGKSKKSKKRADDILADLGLDKDGKKEKKNKRERVLDDRDNFDFMNEREVSLGKSKYKKQNMLGLEDLGISEKTKKSKKEKKDGKSHKDRGLDGDKKSSKSKSRNRDGFYDDLGSGMYPNNDNQWSINQEKDQKLKKDHKNYPNPTNDDIWSLNQKQDAAR
jgi:hypothetical protein